MLNFVTNCCKLLKVSQAAEREVSSTAHCAMPCLNKLCPVVVLRIRRLQLLVLYPQKMSAKVGHADPGLPAGNGIVAQGKL